MKLSVAVSLLSLLPATLAFAPVSPRVSPKTSTSLNGWLDNIFGSRTEDKAEKQKEQQDAWTDVSGLIPVEMVPMTDEEEEELMMGELNFDHMPPEEMTGVSEHVARLCATFSMQVYDVFKDRKEKYLLSTEDHPADILVQEDQGIYSPTNPNFGVCVTGDTMILAWRGTQTPTDGLNDFAFSPVRNMAWRKHTKTIKLQGAMTGLVLNDLAKYETLLIEEAKKRGVKEIVTTGHSLGGAMGQIGHTILRAQIQDEVSPWNALAGVNVRSVVYSAPMSTVFEDDYTEETSKFVDELHANSCNLILSNDVVPRGYGYLSFIEDFSDDLVPRISPAVIDNTPIPFFLRSQVNKLVENSKMKLMDNKSFTEMLSVMSEFVHPGNIVYYKDEHAEPRLLHDYGAFYAEENDVEKNAFRSVKYDPIPKKMDMADLYKTANDWHGAIRKGIGYDDKYLH